MNERETKIADILLGEIEKQENGTERFNAIERYDAFLRAVERRAHIGLMKAHAQTATEVSASAK